MSTKAIRSLVEWAKNQPGRPDPVPVLDELEAIEKAAGIYTRSHTEAEHEEMQGTFDAIAKEMGK